MILGIPVVLIAAVAVYMVATVITVRYLKKALYCVDIRSNTHSLLLSWIVGVLFYLLMFWFEIREITFVSFLLFIVITGLLNTGYPFTRLKRWIGKWFK